jgi:hypothetical protein
MVINDVPEEFVKELTPEKPATVEVPANAKEESK